MKFKIGDPVKLNSTIYGPIYIKKKGIGLIKNNKIKTISGYTVNEIVWSDGDVSSHLSRYLTPAG